MSRFADVLLTCFGPFGDVEVNPTQEVTLLATRTLGCRRLSLPTSLTAAPEALAVGLDPAPVAVVATGLAATRSEVSVERVALNVADFGIPDVDGAQPRGGPLAEGAPDALLAADVDLPGLVAALQQAGPAAHVSNTAGTYVCNALYFHLLRWARPRGVPAVFVHLPPPERLPIEEQVAAVVAAVQFVAAGAAGHRSEDA